MEYLMTYGWAILALVLAVGFLFASGAFNPSNFVNEDCKISNDISCTSFQVYGDNGNTVVLLKIKNNYPYKLSVSNAYLLTEDQNVTLSFDKPSLESGEQTIARATINKQSSNIRAKIFIEYNLLPFEGTNYQGPFESQGYIAAMVK